MTAPIKIRRALISVYDKTGIVEFARALHDEFGIEIISSGGTAKVLRDAGIPVTLVEDITGFPEMLDGRVKTLHPKIHAAILADRDNPEHMRQLAEQGIEPIDMVVVNLYPFEKTIAKPDCTFEEAIEMIDIGGPCLLRAAAKNCTHVLVVSDPDLYRLALIVLRERGTKPAELRRKILAFNTFARTTGYDADIASWLSRPKPSEAPTFRSVRLLEEGQTSYGENPHQRGSVYTAWDAHGDIALAGNVREDAAVGMSFNNYADASAALELCAELTRAGLAGSAKTQLAGSPGTQLAGSAKILFARPRGTPQATEEPATRRFAPIRQETATRRKLPHWQVPGATYFITFLSDVGELSETERDIVMEALRYWDGSKIDLHAAVVTRDHVHALLTPREAPDEPGAYYNLSEIIQSIKANSGRSISKRRGGVGRVWIVESYDRWIRGPDDFTEKWDYIAQNPVKEGLAPTPNAYRWWYGVDFHGYGIGVDPADRKPPPVLGGSLPAGKGAQTDGKEDLCLTHPIHRTHPTHLTQLSRPTRPKAPSLAVCFIKHTNACGAAVEVPKDPSPQAHNAAALEAYRKAYLGDPNAAMGGILAVNFPVGAEFATAVMETYQRWGKPLKEAGHAAAPGAFFIEVWLAPSFDKEAVQIIRGEKEGAPQKAWGQRVRLLDVGDMSIEPDPNEMDLRRIAGGMLMQTRDLVGLNEEQWKVVTERKPTDAEMNDLRLAWLICKHTKSNAITICRDGMLIGNGAGQMSRVMSCRIAAWLAKENGHEAKLKGATAASDAFFPFRDGPDILADAGVTAIIQPGGSKRDREVIVACDERGVAMIFTGTRHFKH